ncbi:hypothetical protein Scep_006875 [Stephania cephalantha]|uniref:Uncharacterized protein n=1 Tax=Stephania cephalantha TaxID=152367 RepID=A0AAP0PKI3_9MAGN
MDRIMKKLRLAQRKAQEMRTSISANQSHQIVRASNRTLSFQEVVASLDMPSSASMLSHYSLTCTCDQALGELQPELPKVHVSVRADIGQAPRGTR